ncbi:MAG: MFS transporter [Clostridia bacterium]|nr:MFS transporter [Clostridia bacterium]
MNKQHKKLKMACYTVNVTMAVVGNISPLLFLTFREQYGISYSLLGMLVVINFATQLGIDLVFSFFSHKFNIPKVVRAMPLLTFIGLSIFAFWPLVFPKLAYLGIAIGTIIFSASSGLAEVLISPIIASIPAKDPDREMSKLHSVYAWGVVGVVVISTLYLLVFGKENWNWLICIYLLLPILSSILFGTVEITCVHSPEKTSDTLKLYKNPMLWVSVVGLFLGGATEVTMAQWSSSYLEYAMNIPKVWGDIFGVALFGVTLGLGRSLYGKFGKNITRVLLVSAIGATGCYLIAGISNNAIVGLIACAFTGFCASMMWPGGLVVATNNFPSGGVVVFALMAAGGDMGASVGPQLVGVITDFATTNQWAINFAKSLSLTPDRFGMKLGMLSGMLFPLFGIIVYAILHKHRKKDH